MEFLPFIKKEFNALKQMQVVPPPDNPEQTAALECCNAIANKLLSEGWIVRPSWVSIIPKFDALFLDVVVQLGVDLQTEWGSVEKMLKKAIATLSNDPTILGER